MSGAAPAVVPAGQQAAQDTGTAVIAQTVEQGDRIEAAEQAGWVIRRDPVRLEFTAARELHTSRTLDGLLGQVEASSVTPAATGSGS